MKAKEFDELFRSRFEEGDFAYNPGNWDKLVTQMDKKPNKSRMLLWLPMAAIVSFSSIAASLAMIITFPALVHHKDGPAVAAMHKPAPAVSRTIPAAPVAVAPAINQACTLPYNYIAYTPKNITAKPQLSPIENVLFGTHSRQLLPNSINHDLHLSETLLKGIPDAPATPRDRIDLFANADRFYEPGTGEQKSPRSVISLLGGINHGTQSAGYTIGFTAKTMISAKMYVEGDVAFVNNSNAGKTEYAVNTLTPTAKLAATTKQLDVTGTTTDNTPAAPPMASKATSFGMYYAQFTPTVGYNVHKRLSVGAGVDMQQLLQNTAAANDVVSDKIAPQFDMGVVGKTEYTLSTRMKAAVSYRRGITNVLIPADRYIDRSYMQVQVKYSIFNK